MANTWLVATILLQHRSRVLGSFLVLSCSSNALSSEKASLTTLPEMTFPNYSASHDPLYFLHSLEFSSLFVCLLIYSLWALTRM